MLQRFTQESIAVTRPVTLLPPFPPAGGRLFQSGGTPRPAEASQRKTADDSHPVRSVRQAKRSHRMKTLLTAIGATLFLAASVSAADVDALTAQLKDKDAQVRRTAAKGLAEAGADALPAETVLIKALKDDDAFVRRFASARRGALGAPATNPPLPPETILINPQKKKNGERAT